MVMTRDCHTFAKAGRAIVALAAAYAFVLQVLLLSVMASQAAPAASDTVSAVICFGADDGSHSAAPDGTPPAKTIHCSLLCAQAMAVAVPAPSAAPLGFVFAASTPLTPLAVSVAAIRAPPSPKLSQGPPQIA
jgi:hypothetical protein